LNLRPLDPQITAHRSRPASCEVKQHLQAGPGLLSVLSLLYSAAVLHGKKFTLLERELTVADGELTPKLKVRRRDVEQAYRDRLDAMYR
jgi:hypothetical protein